MKKIIYICIMVLALTGCEDKVSLEDFAKTAKITVYCMPTASDTTYVLVTRSIPVKNANDTVEIKGIENAKIEYSINGMTVAATPIGEGYYYVASRQEQGDLITLKVSAEGMNTVGGSTVIPDTIAIGNGKVRDISIYNSDDQRSENYKQVSATFTDDAKTHSYYAVRVRLKKYYGYAKGYYGGNEVSYWDSKSDFDHENEIEPFDSAEIIIKDSCYSTVNINTESEPLLGTPSDIDDFFGFLNNFYSSMYIFDDKTINGKTYTLHLNIPEGYTYNYNYNSYNFDTKYQVELYKITPEYYQFLKSINNQDNNEYIETGLTTVQPITSNVTGGLGMIGGWNCSRSEWITEY